MRVLCAAIQRFDESAEGDAVGVVVLFACLFGGLWLTGGL